MGAAGGIAIAGANMWALLLDKDPGHSAAASDLALDVVDRKLKKAAPVAAVVEVEEAPPARNVAKPAKRGYKAKKNKTKKNKTKKNANVYDGNSRIDRAVDTQQTAAPDTVPNGGELADGREEIEEMLAALRSIEEAEKNEAKKEVFNVVTGRRRTVTARAPKAAAPVVEGIATGSANMWALLLDKDPGHSSKAGDLAVDVLDRKLKKAAHVATVKVEETPQAGNVAKPAKPGDKAKTKKNAAGGSKQHAANVYNGKVQVSGAADSKQTLAPVTVLAAAADELMEDEEIMEALAALRSKEAAEQEGAKEEMFQVVTARGGRRRTVTARTSKAAVVSEGATVVTGTNMWALLSDDNPGHSSTTEGGSTADDDEVWINGQKEAAAVIPVEVANKPVERVQVAKPVKQGKKTKTKKKNATRDSKKAAAIVDDEEEEEMNEDATTGSSRCLTVASRVCRAVAAVAMLALYFQLAS